MVDTTQNPVRRIFYGWWIVLATSLIHFWGAGTFFYSFTAFFNPIVDEFGWSYAATAFAASIRSLEGGIASPLVGYAVDRYGARRLLLFGSIVSGLAYIFFSTINSLLSFYLVFVFLSIGSSCLFPVPGWTVVANWFVEKKGIAMGLISAAIGLGGALVYIVSVLIDAYGWRTTLIITGVGMWVIGIPSSLVVRNRPEPYGLFPDGKEKQKSASDIPQEASPEKEDASGDYTARQALKTGTFWILSLSVTISAAVLHAVFVHIMPYLISIKFSRESASIVASFLVFVSVAGRLGIGWLSTRMNKQYLLATGLFFMAVGLFFLARAQGLFEAIMFALFFGPGYGGIITIRLVIQAEYFGRKAFGTIQGITMAIIVLGTIVSPFLTGLAYDVYGSYRTGWYIMIIVSLACIPLALMIRPPRRVKS